MAISAIVKTAVDGTLSLADGTGTPVTLTATLDNGDVSLTGLGKQLNEAVAIQRRGRHVSHRYGARSYPQLSVSSLITDLTAASAPGTLAEFVTGTGAYSANVSTSAASGDVYTCDVTLTIEGTDLGDSADKTIVCTDVAFTLDFSEAMEGDSVSLTGTVYGSVSWDGEDLEEIS